MTGHCAGSWHPETLLGRSERGRLVLAGSDLGFLGLGFCLGLGLDLGLGLGLRLGFLGEFGFGVPPRGFVTWCEGVAAPGRWICLWGHRLSWIWMRCD